MWCWRRMEKIGWNDRVRNKEAIHSSQGEEEYLKKRRRKAG